MHKKRPDPIDDLNQVTQAVRADFGRLTAAQLNWKPSAESWSVAQCLDHLITINSLYFPVLEAIGAGTNKPTFWDRYSPLSGFLGETLIRTLSPEYPRKTKTNAKAEPSASEIDATIVERFVQHQAELTGHIRRIPAHVDPHKTIVTSPLLAWVTYSLADCLTLLSVHERRHLVQARRVTEHTQFPMS